MAHGTEGGTTRRTPAEDAGAAGLTHASDARPGIRRLRAGRGFRYVHPDGSPVREARTLERIASLAIPPAYDDVWISPDPRGHLQATGRDARGRKQYRYHPRWRAVRDETKFDGLVAFGRKLPAIRRRVARDLRRPGLPREKVLALVVRLLEDTCVRVGNDEYARDNRTYGLTTLLDEHVEVSGSRMLFEFRGKRGKQHRCQLRDRRLARVVARCQDLPGDPLFQYLDGTGERVPIESADVNAWLRAASGADFTAKHFRTWHGTLLALAALLALAPAGSLRARRRQVLEVIDGVAARLHNARAACRKYYVHPLLLALFEEDRLAEELARARAKQSPIRGLLPRERDLVALLESAAGRARPSRRRGSARSR